MNEALRSNLDRRHVRRLFEGCGAEGVESELSRRVAEELLSRLDLVRLRPGSVIDAGCGSGRCARALAARYPDAAVVGLDVAVPLLAEAARDDAGRIGYVAGHADFLPLADRSVDMIVSSLALPWCELIPFAVESHRILRPEGLLLFSTLGPDTLVELRDAWAGVDELPHVHALVEMHDIGDVLVQAGVADPVMDVERVTVTYREMSALFADLKTQGFTNAHAARRRSLTGRQRFAGFRRALEAGRNADGLLTLTYEVVYGQAWAPVERQAGRVEVAVPGAS